MGERCDFERRMRLVRDLSVNQIEIHPIYLECRHNNLRNLLNPKTAISGFIEIFRTLCTLKPDAVLVFFVMDAYPLAVLKRLLGYHLLVVAVGGDINRRQRQIHILIRRMIYSQTDMILAVSNDLSSKIQRESGREAMIVPTGVEPSFFTKIESKEYLRRKWNLPQDAFVIFTVSNLERHKGVDIAIRALSLARSTIPRIRLAVAGTGSQKSNLDRLVAELKLGEQVNFLGELDREEMRELYSAVDLFILSSWNEGLPFALLEAMSCECASLSSPVGDIPIVIRDGQNGFLAETIRPEDFAEKIERIHSMREEEITRIKTNARRTIIERYDLTVSATNILNAVLQCGRR